MNIQHEVVADSGLVYNHAYSLLEARAVENKKGRQINLLRIRNPWNRRTNLRLKVFSSINYYSGVDPEGRLSIRTNRPKVVL